MADVDEATICKFYVEGRCRFGSECQNSHPAGVASARKPKKKAVKSPSKSGISPENDESKLPPMKTSRDVIRRIQWDDEFPSDNVTIGYLDRFVGVVEQRYDAFDWTTDIAAVDTETVLAIPQHRIQYFKYRGRKIWDKNERLDLVFGSTSSSKEDISTLLQSIDDDLVFQEETFCETEDIPDSKEKKPTHFLAIRIDNPDLVSALVSTASELAASGRVPPVLYHITLNLLSLETLDQVSHCVGLLNSMGPNFFPDPPSTIAISGTDTYSDRVLFARVCDSVQLTNMVGSLFDYLQNNGVCVLERPKEFHVTLVKGYKNVKDLKVMGLEDKDFGQQGVEYVYLCAFREAPDVDGFYRVTAAARVARAEDDSGKNTLL